MGGHRKHTLAVFAGVTFGFSWVLWGLMIASQRGLLPFTVPTHWSGSFGPALGGLAAAAWSGGAPGVKALLARFRLWRAGPLVWAAALFGIVLAYGAALLLWSVRMGRWPDLEPFGKWAELFVYLPVILVIGGPLGEEVGWRGFQR